MNKKSNKLFTLLNERYGNNNNKKTDKITIDFLDCEKSNKEMGVENNDKERIIKMIKVINNNFIEYKSSFYFENLRQKEYNIRKKEKNKAVNSYDPNYYDDTQEKLNKIQEKLNANTSTDNISTPKNIKKRPKTKSEENIVIFKKNMRRLENSLEDLFDNIHEELYNKSNGEINDSKKGVKIILKRENQKSDETETEKNVVQKKIYTKKMSIEAKVNNISDLLDIINTYKCEPDTEYNINLEALHNIKEPLIELNSLIGMKELKENIVDQIIYFIQNLHLDSSNKKANDFLHTVIYGPPGTGKTEVAKIMGQIYSKLGILKKGKFRKVTRSDLVAGYLGQTAIKTADVIKDALDGVLFIDEAYALGNNEKRDSFAKECIDTLCEGLSDHKDRLMVIIAGYETELKECFFSFNQGLELRFSWRFKIDDYKGDELYKIFSKKIADIGWSISETDVETTKKLNPEWFNKNLVYFKFFGRDIETLLSKVKICHSKRVFGMQETEKRKITYKDLEKGFEIFCSSEEIKKRKENDEMKYRLSSLYI